MDYDFDQKNARGAGPWRSYSYMYMYLIYICICIDILVSKSIIDILTISNVDGDSVSALYHYSISESAKNPIRYIYLQRSTRKIKLLK